MDEVDFWYAVGYSLASILLSAAAGYSGRLSKESFRTSAIITTASANDGSNPLAANDLVCVHGEVITTASRALATVDNQAAAFVFSQQGRHYADMMMSRWNGSRDIASLKAVEIPWGIAPSHPLKLASGLSDVPAHVHRIAVQPHVISRTANSLLSSLVDSAGFVGRYPLTAAAIPSLYLHSTYRSFPIAPSRASAVPLTAFPNKPTDPEYAVALHEADIPLDVSDEPGLLKLVRALSLRMTDGTYTVQRYLPIGAVVSVIGRLTLSGEGSNASFSIGPIDVDRHNIMIFTGSANALARSFSQRAQLFSYAHWGLLSAALAFGWMTISAVFNQVPTPLALLDAGMARVFGEAAVDAAPLPNRRARVRRRDLLMNFQAIDPVDRAADAEDRPALMGEEECVICRLNRPLVAVVPCGHLALCVTCARVVVQQRRNNEDPPRCMMCNTPMEAVMRVYGLPDGVLGLDDEHEDDLADDEEDFEDEGHQAQDDQDNEQG